MPNRIIKESVTTSRTLDALSDGAERMHHRLTTVADDYGRFDADERVLLSRCFPLRSRLSPAKVAQWRDEMTRIAPGDDHPLIQLYRVRGRLYGQYVNFDNHQRKRDSKPKFPGPEEGELVPPPQLAANGGEPPQNAALSVSVSESRETRGEIPRSAATQPRRGGVTDAEFLEALRTNPAYAHIALEAELAKMDAWLLTHPGRQKTRRFVVNWLNKIERPVGAVGLATCPRRVLKAGKRFSEPCGQPVGMGRRLCGACEAATTAQEAQA